MSNVYDGFRELKCPVCGRNFIYNHYSVFRRNVKGHLKYFCRYNCMVAHDLREEAKKVKKNDTE